MLFNVSTIRIKTASSVTTTPRSQKGKVLTIEGQCLESCRQKVNEELRFGPGQTDWTPTRRIQKYQVCGGNALINWRERLL